MQKHFLCSHKHNVHLDKRIKKKLRFCAMLSESVYYSKNKVLIWETNKDMIIAIRGTVSVTDWINNFSIKKENDIHGGFFYHSQQCIEQYNLSQVFKNTKKPITICAHSLGAAVATIIIFQLSAYVHNKKCNLIMFGSPMPGGATFANDFKNKLPNLNIYNFQNIQDIICRLPCNHIGYTHIGNTYLLSPPYLKYQCFRNHSIETYIREINKF